MRAFLLTTLLLTGGFTGLAQTTDQPSLPIDQPTLASAAAPRTTTVLALATPTPLPALSDLTGPLPASPTTQPLRPNDGIRTTQWVLGIASAVVALLLAVRAAK